jgi:transcriptional regulator with XRE-family HTH domain
MKPLLWETLGDRIADMRRKGYTLQKIGDLIGVSRERVRQIIKKRYGAIEPEVWSENEVERQIGCSHRTLEGFRRKGLLNPKRYGRCWLYDAAEVVRAKLLWETAREKRKRVVLKCAQCGGEFQLRPSDYRSRLRRRKVQSFFCSRHCYGVYLARHHGFGTPGHISPKWKRKWDWDMVWLRHLETGYGAPRLSRQLGIPEATIGMILSHIRMRGGVLMTESDYNNAIAQLWVKYRGEKAKLIARLREKYDEEFRRLNEKYRDEIKNKNRL